MQASAAIKSRPLVSFRVLKVQIEGTRRTFSCYPYIIYMYQRLRDSPDTPIRKRPSSREIASSAARTTRSLIRVYRLSSSVVTTTFIILSFEENRWTGLHEDSRSDIISPRYEFGDCRETRVSARVPRRAASRRAKTD